MRGVRVSKPQQFIRGISGHKLQRVHCGAAVARCIIAYIQRERAELLNFVCFREAGTLIQ